jgi:hypothetical protein
MSLLIGNNELVRGFLLNCCIILHTHSMDGVRTNGISEGPFWRAPASNLYNGVNH